MSKAPKELTIALDGEVTARDLAHASQAFAHLLDSLAEEEAPGVALDWVITDLSPGSSILTAQCRPHDKADDKLVGLIMAAGRRFGEDLESGTPRMAGPRWREIAAEFRSLPKGRLVRIRLETPDRDYVLAGSPRAREAQAQPRLTAFGSVRGRVQAMSSHGSLRFTLYDMHEDRGISCYLTEDEDAEQKMLGLWGKTVEVEGKITRDFDSGRALTVRGIRDIAAIDAADWRHAIAAAPGFLGAERAEDIIRRARDE